jgi:hypothetical protein
LRSRGVTHIVVPASEELQMMGIEKIFVGPRYQVFRLKGSLDGG